MEKRNHVLSHTGLAVLTTIAVQIVDVILIFFLMVTPSAILLQDIFVLNSVHQLYFAPEPRKAKKRRNIGMKLLKRFP